MEYVKGSRLKKMRMRMETDTQFIPGGKKLKVRGKELDELPAEMFVLTELEVLDLSPERESCIYYRLAEVPSAIARLTNLKVLMLDTNSILEIPEAVTRLPNLQKLSLSNNALVSLPEGFENMQALESLHAANNEFQEFPASICELKNLHFLDMCDNKLKSIPESIGQCTGLETLLLFMNSLTALPDGICQLVELRSLWIGDNMITRLPRRFAELERLDWGSRYTSSCVVDKNPLKHPPMYICKQGVAAIANYFHIAERSSPNRALSTKPSEVKNG